MAWWNPFKRKTASADQLAEILRGYSTGTRSGQVVTAESAMRQATVYACVAVISESVAQTPCLLYRKDAAGGRERATDHPLYNVLRHSPNGWQTAFEFWEMMAAHVALRGNAFAFVNRARGQVRELIPIHPDDVKVRQLSDRGIEYTLKDGSSTRVTSDVLHLRYRSLDGIEGLSPIAYNRETIGLAMAATDLGAAMFGSGATLSGVLSVPGELSPEAIRRIADSFNEAYHGPSRAGRTAVLDNGAEWKPVSLTAEDAQYIETRKLQRSEIAAIYRVPPHKIGDLEKATFSNIEHQSIEFVRDSLTPWLRRFEGAIKRDLIGDDPSLDAEFLVEGLLRGDSAGRAQFYKELYAVGALSANEIRDRENMNRIGPEGDMRYVPANLMPLGASSAGEQNDA